MSFYFPGVTSEVIRKEYKEKVDNKLRSLYEDLENLIYWEDRLNFELYREEKKSDYVYLKNVINKVLDK